MRISPTSLDVSRSVRMALCCSPPAGHFEDPSISTRAAAARAEEMTPTRRGRRGGVEVDPTSSSSVFIYSRANFSRPPIGQIPGFKKASVAVRFSPVLYSLRPGLAGETGQSQSQPVATSSGIKAKEVKYIAVQPGKNQQSYTVDLNGPVLNEGGGIVPTKPLSQAPTPTTTEGFTFPSTPTTPASNAPTPPVGTSSVFSLPYRMMFSIATMDTITIHDTQQAGPYMFAHEVAL